MGQGDLLKAIERLMLPGIGLRIWCADCCQDRIFVSWVLHALSQANIELPTTQYCKIPRYGIGEEDIDQLGSQAATISAVDMAYGSDVWTAFAKGQPDRLHDLCLADCSSANRLDLSGITKEYSRLFPRWYDGLLQVSDFDAAILNCLSTESWRTPRDLVVELIDEIPRLGDLEVAYRIDQWAAHLDDHGAVIKKELADGKSSFTRVTYRLTERGQQILREGLDDLSDAPEFYPTLPNCSVGATRCIVAENRGSSLVKDSQNFTDQRQDRCCQTETVSVRISYSGDSNFLSSQSCPMTPPALSEDANEAVPGRGRCLSHHRRHNRCHRYPFPC